METIYTICKKLISILQKEPTQIYKICFKFIRKKHANNRTILTEGNINIKYNWELLFYSIKEMSVQPWEQLYMY